MKKKIFLISIILLVFVFSYVTSVYGFTEEEQTKINNAIATMIENSKKSGGYDLTSGTNRIYLQTNFTYNGQKCSYLALCYWNSQYIITLTDDVLKAQCSWYNYHELPTFYFDAGYNLIGYECPNLLDGTSVTFSGINSYFSSTFTVKDSSGNVVAPYLTPLGITETLVEETMKAKIMEQMKIIVVGFLKYLIVLVVSLIAFWKGWQFLSMQLRKA